MMDARRRFNILKVKQRLSMILDNSFAWDFLQKIDVSGIAFPWAVLEHCGGDQEMIVKVDMNPGNPSMTWDSQSWAPFLNAAASIGSSVFYTDPQMRIVSQIDQVLFISNQSPPKIGYLFIEKANDKKGLAAHISVLGEQGDLLAKLHSMRFSEVEGISEKSTSIDGLVHQMAWVPAHFSEQPLAMNDVVLMSQNVDVIERFTNELKPLVHTLVQASFVQELSERKVFNVLNKRGAVLVCIPTHIQSFDDVPDKAHELTWELTSIVKSLSTFSTPPKLFIIIDSVYKGRSPTTLAQAVDQVGDG